MDFVRSLIFTKIIHVRKVELGFCFELLEFCTILLTPRVQYFCYSKFSQDSIDLFLGNYVIEEGRPAPRVDRGWKYLTVSHDIIVSHEKDLIVIKTLQLPGVWCIAVTMMFATVLLPKGNCLLFHAVLKALT